MLRHFQLPAIAARRWALVPSTVGIPHQIYYSPCIRIVPVGVAPGWGWVAGWLGGGAGWLGCSAAALWLAVSCQGDAAAGPTSVLRWGGDRECTSAIMAQRIA